MASVDPKTNLLRPPTLADVKASIRSTIHKLIAITQTLEDLPRKRYATFKLEYYPNAPDDYEPPLFVRGDPTASRMTFATHDVAEAPLRMKIGQINTFFNNVSVSVQSVAGALPSAESTEDHAHVIKLATSGNRHDYAASHQEQVVEEELLADAQKRNIIWDAEVSVSTNIDEDITTGLLGERTESGTLAPLGQFVVGKAAREITHVSQLGESASSDQGATQIEEMTPRGNNTDGYSTLSDMGECPQSRSPEPDTPFHEQLGQLNISEDMNATTVSGNSYAVMDLETQHVSASWTSEKASLGQTAEAVDVECDCAAHKGTEDYDVCQCEGPCGRWVHLWCHGYHDSEDPRLPRSFKCFECRLRASQASLITGESFIREYVLKYRELALFRRALKIIEIENPPSASEFRKLVGAPPAVASQLWKRLENDGFIGPEMVDEDGLGLFETRSTHMKAGGGRAKVRKTAKTRYTKNPAISTMMAPYFDPSENAERKLVGLGKESRRKRAEPPVTEEIFDGRLPLSPIRDQNKRKAFGGTQGSEGKSYMLRKTPERSLSNTGKRKMREVEMENAESSGLRRSKRIKVSVAKKDVDLDW